jgi:hypothetical protein
LLAFVSIDLGQIEGVHGPSEPTVAIRHTTAQIENKQVRPATKSVQNRETMVGGEDEKFGKRVSSSSPGSDRAIQQPPTPQVITCAAGYWMPRFRGA